MYIYKNEKELFREEYRSQISAVFSSEPRNFRCRKDAASKK